MVPRGGFEPPKPEPESDGLSISLTGLLCNKNSDYKNNKMPKSFAFIREKLNNSIP